MDEIADIFSYDLTTTVYVAVSIAFVIAYAAIGLRLASGDPQPRWIPGWSPAV